MASTPNFNWATPDNTGLVKNGALDIRTLGNAIDSSMADLKGGTTGQVLTKASGTDMDFTWGSASTPSFVGVRVYQNGLPSYQAIANNTATWLTWNAESIDTNGFHDNVTNNTRLTVPTGLGGKYAITFQMRYYDSNSTGRRVGGIQRNRTTAIATYDRAASSNTQENLLTSTIFQLSAGDYIEVDNYQTSGTTLNTLGDSSSTFFQMQYLGA